MILKSRLLPQKPLNVQCADPYPIAQQPALPVLDPRIQLQAEIDRLQATIKQLEVHIIFHPPSRSLSVEERLAIHFQSIKTAKRQAKLLKQTQLDLAEKYKELNHIKSG